MFTIEGPVIYALLLIVPVALLLSRRRSIKASAPKPLADETDKEKEQKPAKSIMQPPRDDLVAPKEDPYTVEQLKAFDGSDPSKPIYVAIKGTVFDVSHKTDVYGPGKSYNLFAGKDASKALGMSSLKPEDAISDYSTLSEGDMKTLNDWHTFFTKRYNIVGRVVDLPPPSVPTSNM
ncbi:cytochrome b5 [Pleurotus eryngii]|uniref:Cytochrome b5 n=1 Tax=Pleurotus eryngii TaxID=5323 RepID=A0A9P5ZFR5_PLEER|nr:cytochrome b5 [Pleurotus eryngii]